MRLLEFNWTPSDRQLRQFGVISMVAMPLLGWLWAATGFHVAAMAIIGAIVATVGLLFPRILKPVFVALLIVATPIGLVVGEFAMALIYVGVFLPIGLFFRMIGRDALALKVDRDAKSYWTRKKRPSSVSSYYRQS